jgi:hypothetical protein
MGHPDHEAAREQLYFVINFGPSKVAGFLMWERAEAEPVPADLADQR